MSTQLKTRYTKRIVLAASVLVFACVIALFFWLAIAMPTYQERVGQSLPESAAIQHEHGQYGFDSFYMAVISFDDEQAIEQIINAWDLKPIGSSGVSSKHHNIACWPTDRLEEIQQHGEYYGPIDHDHGRWWNLHIDRQTSTLYIEQGSW